jgi:hypothetical protein
MNQASDLLRSRDPGDHVRAMIIWVGIEISRATDARGPRRVMQVSHTLRRAA